MLRIIHRHGTRRITARRLSDGDIRVTLPAGVEAASVSEIIERLVHKLEAAAPHSHTPLYGENQTVACGDAAITIVRQELRPGIVTCHGGGSRYTVEVGSALSMADRSTEAAISDMLRRIARHLAPGCLLPRAREIAGSLSLKPSGWKIGRGTRTLGSCRSDGQIILSAATMFLPPNLRDYIVCHELAHLSEMNHSERFHRICDTYCNGRERQLASELKAFRWPILR